MRGRWYIVSFGVEAHCLDGVRCLEGANASNRPQCKRKVAQRFLYKDPYLPCDYWYEWWPVQYPTGAAVAGLVYNVGKVVYMEVTPIAIIADASHRLPCLTHVTRRHRA